MRKIVISAVPRLLGSEYPPPCDEPCRERERRALGDAAGLTQFGVNLLRLPSGAWSSQRHWHRAEDEFVWVLEGEVVLVSDAGEEVLRAGDCAGFKAGAATATICRTARAAMQFCSKSAPAGTRKNLSPIRTSTSGGTQPAIHARTAPPANLLKQPHPPEFHGRLRPRSDWRPIAAGVRRKQVSCFAGEYIPLIS